MSLDIKNQRRDTLAHCLYLAEKDETYGRWAAAEYERNPVYEGMFAGLLARFNSDWSRIKADRAASPGMEGAR
jgi:hypothetical protein